MSQPIYTSHSLASQQDAHNTNDLKERHQHRRIELTVDRCEANRQFAKRNFKNLDWLNNRK